jgi:diguanylate cyclase (GGDEF)-like protein
VVRSLDEGVVVVDHKGRVLSVNPAVRRLLGFADGDGPVDYEEVAERWRFIGDDVMSDPGRALSVGDSPILTTLSTGIPYSGEVYSFGATGERLWLSVTARRLNPDEGDRSAVLITFRDITAVRAATERFAHQATHDPLTGLPNRTHLVERVERLLSDGMLGAVLFVDLDDFKVINDTMGHDVGDSVIQMAAQRIRMAVRKIDLVCRLAGDEFVVLLVGALDGAELDRLTARVSERLAQPMSVAGATVYVAGSIGVVETRNGELLDAAAVLRQADRAMYAAKARGRRPARYVAEG